METQSHVNTLLCVQFNVSVSESKSGKTGKVSSETFGLYTKE